MSSNQAQQANDAEKNIEIWKVKKLIKRLEAARGNGTSMISLIIRMFFFFFLGGGLCVRDCGFPGLRFFVTAPKDQVSRAAKMLAEEFVSFPLFLAVVYGKQERSLCLWVI